MSELVKAAIIIAVAIIVGVGLWLYFSPYHSCVRAMGDQSTLQCAALTGGYRSR